MRVRITVTRSWSGEFRISTVFAALPGFVPIDPPFRTYNRQSAIRERNKRCEGWADSGADSVVGDPIPEGERVGVPTMRRDGRVS